MRKQLSAATLVVLALTACGATATRVNGPDGEPGWFSIDCKRNEGNCEEKAGDTCPGGYVTANASGQQGVFVSDFGTGHYSATPTFRGHMLIKCKGAPSPDAD